MPNVDEMVKGWFIGPFKPAVLHTEAFEVAVKRYRAGDREAAHVHKIATEFTVVVEGRVRMNGKEYGRGEIVEVKPGEPTDFEVLEDTSTVVVKVPAALGDKYELPLA